VDSMDTVQGWSWHAVTEWRSGIAEQAAAPDTAHHAIDLGRGQCTQGGAQGGCRAAQCRGRRAAAVQHSAGGAGRLSCSTVQGAQGGCRVAQCRGRRAAVMQLSRGRGGEQGMVHTQSRTPPKNVGLLETVRKQHVFQYAGTTTTECTECQFMVMSQPCRHGA